MTEAREVLLERVHALGRAHELLMRTDWKGAPIRDIIGAELAPFSAQVQIEGPEVIVHGRMVQTFALVLHELATNAAKHGSLSNQKGRVSVTWTVSHQSPSARFRFQWEEQNGPTVKPPARKGFGSTLLAGAFPADLSVEPRLSFEPGGFVYELEAPLSEVTGDPYGMLRSPPSAST